RYAGKTSDSQLYKNKPNKWSLGSFFVCCLHTAPHWPYIERIRGSGSRMLPRVVTLRDNLKNADP
ncbi:MAG TPA: hypothetical protein VMW91_10430, partial [Desulfosporosinus sp.]|nr:hypothetical protein [Desulfosporosinus sp.]